MRPATMVLDFDIFASSTVILHNRQFHFIIAITAMPGWIDDQIMVFGDFVVVG